MAENVPDYQMGIQVNQGSLKKIGPNKYTWTICSSEKRVVLLKIYNNRTLIDSIKFRLVALPDPEIFTTVQDGEIIFKGIKATMAVRAEITNPSLDSYFCRIQQFKIVINKRNGEMMYLENPGGDYSKKTIEAFEKLNIGDKVTLTDFLVTVGCEPKPRLLKTILTQVYSGKKYQLRY